MKILLVLLLFISVSHFAKSQLSDNGFTMECEFEGLPDNTKVFLKTQNSDTIARTTSNGSKFTFQGKLSSNGEFHFIHFDHNVFNKGTLAIFVKNQHLKIKGTIGKREVTVLGIPEQTEYDSVMKEERDHLSVFNQHLRKVDEFVQTIQFDSLTNEPIKVSDKVILDSIKTLTVKLMVDRDNEIKKWISAHPNSLLTPYIMEKTLRIENLSFLDSMYNALSTEAQNSYYGKRMKKELKYAGTYLKIELGEIFPNIPIIDSSGNATNIHEVIKGNKLTLIDCWASWCKPCRAQLPLLKEVYSKFKKDGFNILAISSDRSEIAWKKAVVEDKSSWNHFIESKENPFSKMCSIEGIPSFILLDKDGKLLAFDAGMSMIGRLGKPIQGENLPTAVENALKKQSKQ
ncbi:thioredoxin-like domain-containing protein [Chitinophaga rhizosphaerae]|uniref:thioredoxin-like domain-containing protein n=1 Tax=Chitinophaga rhizosphaerae TaxID=1864947 RepID=UPI000F809B65|nr:thioredoxin-like domain-containing protein [Chitinophaga rhizosphaerae]